jgi:protein-disulfide isomerase
MSDQQPPAPHNEPSQHEREWIAVAPQHPYAAPPSQTGRGLAIAAMTLGLVALLTAAVAAWYFNFVAFFAGALGVAAVILAVIALVKRQRPQAASITGLASGALSVVAAIVIGTVGVMTLFTNAIALTDVTDPPAQEETEEWEPGDPAEALIEWPANMASGGIVFASNGGDPLPLTAPPLEPGTAPQPYPIDRAGGTADVLIYVDYRCPHCMSFELANAQLLELAIDEGATVEIVPVSFLDRASEGTYYSSRAAGAMSCLADSQPEAAWAAHQALLTPQVQPAAGPGLTNDDLVAVIDGAVGGLQAEARDCIETERFVGFAQALNSWVFATTAPNAIDPNLRVQGTPTVLVNGVLYEGDPSDAAAFGSFFLEQIS